MSVPTFVLAKAKIGSKWGMGSFDFIPDARAGDF